jgi:UPF0716 protein FxsA
MHPFALLLSLFIVVPVVEVYLFVRVGEVIGGLWTALAVVFTAVVGVSLLRLQGLATLHRVQRTLGRGELPAVELVEGALLLVAGAVLITPGFLTDAAGFAILVPPLRRALAAWAVRRLVMGAGPAGQGRRQARRGERVIEGEYRREDRR